MIKAVIFDCYGVLIENVFLKRYREVEKVDAVRAQQISDVNRATDRGLISEQESVVQLAELFGITPAQYEGELSSQELRNDALIEFIKTLKPKVHLAMLSNVSSRAHLDDRFLPGQLDELFETVVASGDEGMAKPDTEIYQRAAMRLGVLPEECVMIDDVPAFCEGAKLAGMQAIHFTDTQKCIQDISLLIDRGGER